MFVSGQYPERHRCHCTPFEAEHPMPGNKTAFLTPESYDGDHPPPLPFPRLAAIMLEGENHFLNICPAYQEKRCSLLEYLEKEYRIKISRMSPNRIFMCLINSP